MLLIVIAAVPVVIWIYLLLGRGSFWQVRRQLMPRLSGVVGDKRVVAVIPARNEAEVIGRAVTSLLAQHFPAPLHIVVVNDNSTDGTAEAARTAAELASAGDRLSVLKGERLSPGWTGKLWAMSQGVAHALNFAPDYLLFTDADIEHGADTVAQLVALAEERGLDLASFMVKLACETTAEKALIPAFVFFFLMLYPPAWIASPGMRTAGAAGGCILIRPSALQRIGGLEKIRNNVIDDCALARAVKRSGGAIWMGLTTEATSIRSYGGWSDIGRMISRTAFSQLNHSALLLAGTIVGLLVTYVLPVVLIFSGYRVPALLGAAAWLLMSIAYAPMVLFYRRSPLWSIALPTIAVFYAGATIYSAAQYWCGRGGAWKGRAQDMRT